MYSRPSVANRRAKRHHLAHVCGVCRGDCAAQYAPQAMPDDCHALAGFARDLFHPPSHQFHRALRASDVEIDSRQIGTVADAPEPSRQRAERPIARGESGNQQYRMAVAARHSDAVADRVANQRSELLQKFEVRGDGKLQQHPGC